MFLTDDEYFDVQGQATKSKMTVTEFSREKLLFGQVGEVPPLLHDDILGSDFDYTQAGTGDRLRALRKISDAKKGLSR